MSVRTSSVRRVLISLALLVVLVALVVLVVVSSLGGWVPVSQTYRISNTTPEKLEQPVFMLLSNIRGAEVIQSAPGTYTQHVRRSPGWIWLLVILLFPLGLLFLLVKKTGSLQVSLVQSGPGIEVRLAGRTPKAVLRTLDEAFSSLSATT